MTDLPWLDLGQVSSGSLKKSDPKFKLYLGLCKSADEKAADCSFDPPKLKTLFARESWATPGVRPRRGLGVVGVGGSLGGWGVRGGCG